ncbi:hypothetical protein Zm00014a_019657 [Zea mays]|nr:hypothetical protein Zm00014a_019657 [Zea mays]
MSRIEVD